MFQRSLLLRTWVRLHSSRPRVVVNVCKEEPSVLVETVRSQNPTQIRYSLQEQRKTAKTRRQDRFMELAVIGPDSEPHQLFPVCRLLE